MSLMKNKAYVNPFVYGKEVSGDNFYDRKDDFDSLVTTLVGGSANVVLYAPRRYGKTSLAKKALAELSGRGFRCIYFDMMRVESVQKFCAAYASSAYSLEKGASRAMRRIGEALSSLRPKFTLGDDGKPAVELDFATPATDATVEAALDLPERFATQTKQVIVVFDEFQEIGTLSPTLPLEGIFRSCIQRHKNVRYLFLGSKTHLMKRMFGDRSRPFYNSAAIQHLEVPPRQESESFVRKRFASAGMGIDDGAIDRVMDASGGIPYYIQAISAFAFDAVALGGGHAVVKDVIERAISRLVESKADLYETTSQSLSPVQRSILSSLARRPVARFDSKFRAAHGLGGSSSVHSALEVLLTKGIVELTPQGYALGDPIFAIYLSKSPYQLFAC